VKITEKFTTRIKHPQNTILEAESEGPSETGEIETLDLFDRDYSDGEKRHRNTIAMLSHWLEVACHPAVLIGIVIIIGVTAFVLKYIGVGMGIELFQRMSSDLWNFLSYVGTVGITHIVTRFLEGKKREKAHDDIF
jgi:hypothetical protein